MRCPVCSEMNLTYQGKSVNSDIQVYKCDKCGFIGSVAMFYEVENFKTSDKYMTLIEYFDNVLHKDFTDNIDFIGILSIEMTKLASEERGYKDIAYKHHKMMNDLIEFKETLESIKDLRILVK